MLDGSQPSPYLGQWYNSTIEERTIQISWKQLNSSYKIKIQTHQIHVQVDVDGYLYISATERHWVQIWESSQLLTARWKPLTTIKTIMHLRLSYQLVSILEPWKNGSSIFVNIWTYEYNHSYLNLFVWFLLQNLKAFKGQFLFELKI